MTHTLSEVLAKLDSRTFVRKRGNALLQGGGLDSLLGSIKSYEKIKVADYQRNYTWQTEDVVDLFGDLVSLVDHPNQTHFTGSLIIQQDENDANPRVCEIVDGQQRLTTFFLIMGRIRDEIIELPEQTLPASGPGELPVDILRMAREFLYAPGLRTTDLKFESNRLLNKMFTTQMLQEKPRPEPPIRDHKLKDLSQPLRDAYRTVEKLLKVQLLDIERKILVTDESGKATESSEKIALEKKLFFLYRIILVITDQVQVLKVTTNRVEESLNVFMTLNARGVPLGPSDLVRGQILQNLSTGMEESKAVSLFAELMEEWKDTLENLSGGDIDQFLRHFIVSENGETVTKSNLVKRASELIDDLDIGEKRTKTRKFWNNLVRMSSAYKELINPRQGTPYSYHLSVLKAISVSYRILLMTVFDPELRFPEETKRDLVEATYVLVFRYFAAGKNAQDLETEFEKLSLELRSHLKPEEILDDLKKMSRIEFNVAEYLAKRVDSTSWAKAILHGIENAIRKSSGANFLPLETTTMHLEHIAPQTPTPHWRAALVDPTDDEYSNLIESLGNKALLDARLNKKAQQDPFKAKKDHYKFASSDLTRELLELADWNPAMISERLIWLTDMYEIIWSPVKSSTSPVDFRTWRLSKK